MDDRKTYKYTDQAGEVHYLMLDELSEAEGYCPVCDAETEDLRRVERGRRECGVPMEPDEEWYVCAECGEARE